MRPAVPFNFSIYQYGTPNMNKLARAKLLLIEIDAVATNEDTPVTELLALVNEVFRDAKALAQDVLADTDNDKYA